VSDNKVADCLDDLVLKLQSIAEFQNSVEVVHTPDKILTRMSSVPGSWCGVLYEGSAASAEDGHAKQGNGTILSVGLYPVIDANMIVASLNTERLVVELLHKMRATILGTVAPTGHQWRFVMEAYADSNKGKVLWQQRWRTQAVYRC